MTRQLEAVLMIAEAVPSVRNRLLAVIDQRNETIYWEDLNYGVLSGGEKAAVSWAYAVWTDAPVPDGWRDPFEGFWRHGFRNPEGLSSGARPPPRHEERSMSTPSQGQVSAALILEEIRRIVDALPATPEALKVNKVEIAEKGMGAHRSVDFDLGDGRSMTLTIWGNRR
jgi:hypothetical protein